MMGGKLKEREETMQSSKSGIVRALAVLEHVREMIPRTMGVTEIARDLGIAKAVAYRILKDLTAAGYLAFDERSKEYTLGDAAVLLGVTAFRWLDTASIARSHLNKLVELTSETATLTVRQGWTRVYIDQVESPREIRMAVQLGGRYPLSVGATSKAILAALSDEDIREFLELRGSLGVEADAAQTAALWEQIADIRTRGFATSLGEREPSAVSVASPIYDSAGEVWGAISVCGPKMRYEAAEWDTYGQMVKAAATEISLGRVPYSPGPAAA